MKTIDLSKIIEDRGLNTKEVAKELFPKNKYPKLALDRVIKGEAFLDTNQVSRLSLITGVPIQFLYSNGEWKTTSKEEGIVTFQTGEYRAELNTGEWITKIYHKGSIFHESVIHQESITLSKYLKSLTELIIKHDKS